MALLPLSNFGIAGPLTGTVQAALNASSAPVNPNQTDLSKFEPGNGPPPGMTWSETQGRWMPSNSVVGAMPTITNELIQPAPMPQQQPYMPIMGDNRSIGGNVVTHDIPTNFVPTQIGASGLKGALGTVSTDGGPVSPTTGNYITQYGPDGQPYQAFQATDANGNPIAPTPMPMQQPYMASANNPGSVPNYVTPPNLATPGSTASGTLTQGSALPNITTTQQQATAAPSWYTDYLSNLAQQGQAASQGAQYVGATPLQQQAFEQTAQNVGSFMPSLEAATNLARQTGEYDVARAAGEFMNPYTERVVNELGRLGRSNIEKYLAPQATAAAVGSGQFGSKRGAEVLGQAINTGLSNLNLAQSQALQTGYGQALQAAQQQEAARLAASQQLGNLASQRQALGLGDINALATLGSQQQQIAQNEQLFPFQTAAQQAALLRGYTIPTSVSSTYTGPIPGAYSPSPLSQIAGVGSLLGALATPGPGGSTSPGANIIGALGSAGKALYDLLPSFSPSSSGFVGLTPDMARELGLYGGSALDTAGASGDVLENILF